MRYKTACLLGLMLALFVPGQLKATTTTQITATSDSDYPVVFDKSQNYTHASRRLHSVSLSQTADGAQTLQLPTPLKVYSLIEDKNFSAMAGETVQPGFGFTGTWMNGFVYIDCNQDGQFQATINADGNMPEGSEAMAFSYAEPTPGSGAGYNSNGERVSNANVLTPPAFKIPANLKNGVYRMRYKVDWASIDPAGRAEDGNGILKNGGAICDVALNIHAPEGELTTTATHGTLLTADGQPLPATLPFGKAFTIKVQPEEGYGLDALIIKHGHNFDGEMVVHGVVQHRDLQVPSYLVKGHNFTIPADCVDGDVHIEALFVKLATTTTHSDYALAFDPKTSAETNYTATLSVQLGHTTTAFAIDDNTIYTDLTQQHVAAYRPNTLTLNISDNRDGLNYYLYADLNNDGGFTPMFNADGTLAHSSELVARSTSNGLSTPSRATDEDATTLSFSIPEMLPEGVYRLRLKADTDDIAPEGSAAITENGGAVVDFLISISHREKALRLTTVNGSIHGANYTGVPQHIVPLQSDLALTLQPGATGFEATEVIVKHGYNLDGPAVVNHNLQWQETRLQPTDNALTIDAGLLDGEVELIAVFEAPDGNDWQLVFSDEFNAPDYEQPTADKWIRCQRYNATWNRWLSDSEAVVYQQGGDLVARAIPNPDTSSDPVPMITGGIKSNTKFGFTYGIVEARILTNPWTGNFPAFWMMPEDQSAGWPDCGEIDIWEAIDSQNRSWHTIHSNWTYDLGYKNNPTSSFNVEVDLSRYHVYRLEWNRKTLIWYVDGKEVGRYTRSSKQADLNQGQWPFDKFFHIILNQSVGNGSWAANADVNHTYETRFDWVRVYQRKGMANTLGTVGIQDVATDAPISIESGKGGITVATPMPTTVSVHSLSGCLVAQTAIAHETFIPLKPGLYIVAGQKVVVQ